MKEIRFDDLEVGEEFGPLQYRLTEDKMAAYRNSVEDAEAAFATVGVKDYSRLINSKYTGANFINAGHEAEYLNPPRPGKVLTVRGNLADKYIRRERKYVVMETHTTDEDGREIVRAKTRLILREGK